MSAEKEQGIVLLSGGLDSVVSMACACEEHRVIMALTFDYGQKAAAREIEASRQCCAHFHIPHIVIHLDWVRSHVRSSLLDREVDIPRVSLHDIESGQGSAGQEARSVWVPNRNGLFINAAAVLAESLGASIVVTGFNVEEAVCFPDNSPQFVAAVNRSLQYSTRNAVRVVSFTQHLIKADIVRLGLEKRAPFQFVYSCYSGHDLMCGRCESCQRLKRALVTTGNWSLIEDRFSPD